MKKIILILTIAMLAAVAQAEPQYNFAHRSAAHDGYRSGYGRTSSYNPYGRSTYAARTAEYGTIAGSPVSQNPSEIDRPLNDGFDPAGTPLGNSTDRGDVSQDQGFLEPPMPLTDGLPLLCLLALAFAVVRFAKR